MNAMTFPITPDVETKLSDMAASKGTTVEKLLIEMTDHMIREYEAYKLFEEMRERGTKEVDLALELLRRP
jgi:hypothetical protein